VVHRTVLKNPATRNPSAERSNRVVHPGLWNAGDLGDLAGRQLAVLQCREVRIDLVVAEVELLAQVGERGPEVVHEAARTGT